MNREFGCQPFGHNAEERIECLRMMKDIGFTNYFIGISTYEDADKIINAAENIGIRLETIHSPFKDINRMWYDDPSGEGPLNMMLECLSFCADHKVPIMVIHESANRVGPDMSNAGLVRFRKIFEKGNELGVKIAVENVRRTNHLARIFHENRDIPVYFCWDSGHELCYTPGVDHVAFLGDKLICTHLHDNRGIYMGDDHILPFDGNMNWQRKADFVKAAGYKGPLTMEIVRYRDLYNDWTDEQYLKTALERVKRFAAMCE